MKKNLWNLFASSIAMLYLIGCSQGPTGRYTGQWDHMMGPGAYGGMFMWLILIVIVGIVLYLVFNQSKRSGNRPDSERETPTEILKRRYAKGEITREEFDRLKKDIEG